jgi:hypothetical protein
MPVRCYGLYYFFLLGLTEKACTHSCRHKLSLNVSKKKLSPILFLLFYFNIFLLSQHTTYLLSQTFLSPSHLPHAISITLPLRSSTCRSPTRLSAAAVYGGAREPWKRRGTCHGPAHDLLKIPKNAWYVLTSVM